MLVRVTVRTELRDQEESWPVHGTETVTSTGPFSVRRDVLSAPAVPDEHFTRLVVEHPGACVVLAVDEQGRALVLEQYRHPAGRRLVELPAGLFDVAGEDPAVAARRELAEEAGLAAERWTHLLSSYSSPGISSERIEVFLAEDLSEAVPHEKFVAEHEEADMTTAWAPVEDLLDGVLAGRLTDGPLALAVMAYVLRTQDGSPPAGQP